MPAFPTFCAVPRRSCPRPQCPSASRAIAGARRLGLHLLLLLLVIAAPGSVAPAAAAPPAGELVRAELIAEPAAVAPGEPFWVGVRLAIAPGWHVYWRNPGDSGEAVSVAWQLPAGFSAGPLAWPTPERIPVAHLVNFGYERAVTLLARITPPIDLGAGGPLAIAGRVTWLVCQKECIPGEADVGLSLPLAQAGAAPGADVRAGAAFEAARAALPKPAPWPVRLEMGPERLRLSVDARGLDAGAVRSAYFFPFAETLVQHAAPQTLTVTRDGLTLELQRSALSVAPPTEAGGVLVVEEALGATTARQAFELAGVPIADAAAASGAAPASAVAVLRAALLALVGGLILNLMPCVFPVLSIKVLGLIEHAGGSRVQVRRHGLAYTAGVLATFAALGLLLIGLRSAGAAVGWGFQLQSPVVVAALAYLLLAIGLNLSGVFHAGSAVQALAARALPREAGGGLAGSAATGALAAVVATPCTAPFMAAAVGFALTQTAPVALGVMLALGTGLALPFLVLTLAPRLLARLPRPGPWMATLRQLLAFPVYASVAWLVWVLSQQLGPTGLLAALLGLVLVALAAWSLGAAQGAGPRGRRAALAGLAGSLAGLAVALAGLDGTGAPGTPPARSASHGEPFTQARLDALLASGQPVLVNLTAAWCITCLVNEQTVLSSGAVRAALAAKGVAYLEGDWTSRNPEITRLLERHGRSGVPLYLLYPGGAAAPVVLPQILTPAIVLGEIARLRDRPRREAFLSTAAE